MTTMSATARTLVLSGCRPTFLAGDHLAALVDRRLRTRFTSRNAAPTTSAHSPGPNLGAFELVLSRADRVFELPAIFRAAVKTMAKSDTRPKRPKREVNSLRNIFMATTVAVAHQARPDLHLGMGEPSKKN